MATHYLALYPPDVDCNTDDKIFIRFKVFALPTSITDNFYNVRVLIVNDDDEDESQEIRTGEIAPGDYTARGKSVLWDRKIGGVRQDSGDFRVSIGLYNDIGTLLEGTNPITFTIN